MNLQQKWKWKQKKSKWKYGIKKKINVKNWKWLYTVWFKFGWSVTYEMNNSLQVSQLDSEIPSSKVGLQLNCKQIDTLKEKGNFQGLSELARNLQQNWEMAFNKTQKNTQLMKYYRHKDNQISKHECQGFCLK